MTFPKTTIQEIFVLRMGKIYFKARPLRHFLTEKGQDVFNNQFAGLPASVIQKNENCLAYVSFSLRGKKYSIKESEVIRLLQQ